MTQDTVEQWAREAAWILWGREYNSLPPHRRAACMGIALEAARSYGRRPRRNRNTEHREHGSPRVGALGVRVCKPGRGIPCTRCRRVGDCMGAQCVSVEGFADHTLLGSAVGTLPNCPCSNGAQPSRQPGVEPDARSVT